MEAGLAAEACLTYSRQLYLKMKSNLQGKILTIGLAIHGRRIELVSNSRANELHVLIVELSPEDDEARDELD